MKWIDLFGIDPDYTGGRPVREWAIEGLTEKESADFWDALNDPPAHTCPDCRRIVVRTDGHHCQEPS